MRLLDSPLYNADLKKAVGSMDFSLLDGKSFFVTGGLGLIASTIVDVLLTYGKQEQYILEQEIRHDLKKDMGILKECVSFLMML